MAAIGALYAVMAWWLLARWREDRPGASEWRPPVSVLKPLCGAEARLAECLRSFLRQPYPDMQMVFGVRDAADPAIEVIARMRREFPAREIELVIDATADGKNPKASNLANMLPHARHPVLVISDSDVCVGEGYLDAVLQALAPPDVGSVTCLYRGRPASGVVARLAALFVNDWYFPAVLVSHALGDRSFASGATIALRRQTLLDIGGFRSFSDHLADDWMLCERVRRLGLRTELCRFVVETQMGGETARAHAIRELRWMRTIRVIAPLGYAFMILSMPLPVAFAALSLAGPTPWVLGLGGLTLVGRVGVHLEQRRRMDIGLRYDLALIPLRDALLLGVWLAGFLGRTIGWRGRRYRLAAGGALHPLDG